MELETYPKSDEFELPPHIVGVFCFFLDDWPVLFILKAEKEIEFVDVDR